MASFQGVDHPDPRLNNPALLAWIDKKGWVISPPAFQWQFWHAIVNGGIIPFSYDVLIACQSKD
jgi:hypothetical protein